MVQLDIPMPKTCYECPCHDEENSSCQVTGKYYYDEILRSCPLIELPPAQPERIKGHWVEIASSNHTYKCSVCGRLLVNITDGKNNVAKNYPYCHCGADMRGVQDE